MFDLSSLMKGYFVVRKTCLGPSFSVERDLRMTFFGYVYLPSVAKKFVKCSSNLNKVKSWGQNFFAARD